MANPGVRARLLVEPSPEAFSIATELAPGGHLVVLGASEDFGIVGRLAGLELRDTILVVSGGPLVRFAFLFRKPLVEATVSDQARSTETGGLNIDACRIGTGEDKGIWPITRRTDARQSMAGAMRAAETDTTKGRWPPNAILVHAVSCRGSCELNCPIRLLDVQGGERPSTLTGRADPTKLHVNPGDNGGASLFGGGNSNVYADSGGASRFYPQMANEAELVAWLERLIGVK